MSAMRFATALFVSVWLGVPQAAAALRLVYPPDGHRTESASIYFIGTAPGAGSLQVNGQKVARHPAGHFAWTVPLQSGINTFRWTFRGTHGASETVERQVIRQSPNPPVPGDRLFLEARLPRGEQRVLPFEPVCFEARATPGGQLQARVGEQSIALAEAAPFREPGDAAAVLSGGAAGRSLVGFYRGCLAAAESWRDVEPRLDFRRRGQVLSSPVPATITSLDPRQLTVIEVTAAEAIVRAGPGAEFARLSPLTRGVRSRVTAVSGDWLRLQGEGWIARADGMALPVGTALPTSAVGALRTRVTTAGSELIVPLEMRLPASVRQEEHRLIVTLWGAQARTDLIRFDAPDPLIRSVQWETVSPEGVRFYIDLRERRQWGYQLRYEDNALVVALRKGPRVGRGLAGARVMIDPGHGGAQTGSIGPSGIPEKTVNLAIALRLGEQLRRAGAEVLFTRTADVDVPLAERSRMLEAKQPTVFLSLHHNALPDAGDPLRQYGTSVYWYHMQSRELAEVLHRQLLRDLGRPDYGLYWDSLAVIRPTAAPAVLLELGFMTHPDEYTLITAPAYQERIARALTRGLERWLHAERPE
ncbi:N-acetylmuramoyl-L-alanine amidase [Gloeobacter violaceus]|uniref:N-acetylmuramoyl-L-alanine amidase n=1 Tax=Gloeobacter violaceus (strain ATCC 29082 / PCC 7421) TaxID=251221 RepID=Q7NN91_GLOVI|nr:N-acetylmuramoyl-L-alanine amidase [Gloeobacter violaceus]BAC88463.1 N-acetylmuramoyl-L-alanine amidase [Gloeobacter violaceus PCC 7421]